MLRSESPGGCAPPPPGSVTPKLSATAPAALRGVLGSAGIYESMLETTPVGIARRARDVKNASRGVVRPSIPETVVRAW